jgi:hypothetical protein
VRNKPSILQLAVGTLIHKVPYSDTKRCMSLIDGYGFDITYTELCSHHLAGGRIGSWIDGMIYAVEAGLKIGKENAAARDLLEAYGSKKSLRQHLKELHEYGIKDFTNAPLSMEQIKQNRAQRQR